MRTPEAVGAIQWIDGLYAVHANLLIITSCKYCAICSSATGCLPEKAGSKCKRPRHGWQKAPLGNGLVIVGSQLLDVRTLL